MASRDQQQQSGKQRNDDAEVLQEKEDEGKSHQLYAYDENDLRPFKDRSQKAFAQPRLISNALFQGANTGGDQVIANVGPSPGRA